MPARGPSGPIRLVGEVERAKAAALRRRRDPFRLEVDGPWQTKGYAHYAYKDAEVLVDDADLARVRQVLDARGVGHRVADALIGGVTVMGLIAVADLPQLLDELDVELGVGVVTPNHVLDVQGKFGGMCPATEPLPATVAERWPQVADQSLGAGVRIAVVDTGFIGGYERDARLPWLAGVDRYDEDDEVHLRSGRGRRRIAPYGGHGTFSAGVALSVAPGARVSVDDVLVGGVVDEATIVRQLIQAIGDSPDVISLSAGTYTRKNIPPKALSAFYEHRMRHHKGVALVAAAGNQGDRAPFWPAAFPWALAVGALSRSGDRRMPWSNHGGWVDVYAPGEDVVNAFPNGTYDYLEDDRPDAVFGDRMARWSGTSFATPLVAGLVARRMAQTGEHGVDAAKALRRVAQQQFLPGVGPRLLP